MTTIKAWIYAARPRTLAGAVAPVVIAIAAAGVYGAAALLCLLFALLMQIDANFINDYYDFVKGRDDSERLGPERACAQGWITPRAMWRGIIVTSVLACLTGLGILACVWTAGGAAEVSGSAADLSASAAEVSVTAADGASKPLTSVLILLGVGVACVAAAFLYTTALAQRAMGDVLVVVFFGLVPVATTYYVLCGSTPYYIYMAGAAVGLATECLLLINNFRDRDDDARHGKRTLVTIVGERATTVIYALCGVAAVALVIPLSPWWPIVLAYLIPHLLTARQMSVTGSGSELNAVLAQTARNILIFALLTTITIII